MATQTYECVVVPVDFTADSLAAVNEAFKHIDRPENIRVVHVLPPVDPNEFESVWTPLAPEVRIDETRRALQSLCPSGVEVHVVLGETATAVAEFAQQHGADLVVIAARPRTGLARFFRFGSISEQLVRLCECPVLVLRAAKSPSLRPSRLPQLAVR